MNANVLSHLNAAIAHLIDAGDEDRIRHIQRDRFVEHNPATRVLHLLQDFVLRPPSVRPPCLALIGDAGAGKSTLLMEFMRRTDAATADSSTRRVVYMVADPYPELVNLQTTLLLAMSIPPAQAEYRRRWAADELIQRAIVELGVRVVVIDEISHILNLPRYAQIAVFDWLKWISTACRVSVVCSGIPGSERIVMRERQLETRFAVMRLPCWTAGPAFGQFLQAFEKSLPLRRPSGLGSTEMQEALLKESRVKQQIGGVTHGLKQIIEYAAIEAIRSGEERITRSLLTAWRAAYGYE